MSERLNRREFFKIAGYGLAGLAAGEAARRVELSPDIMWLFQKTRRYGTEERVPALSRWGALVLLRRLDEAADRIEKSAPEPPQTIEEARTLAQEIIPYFLYEGIRANEKIVDYGSFRMTAPQHEVIPESIEAEYFGGERVFHVLGKAWCVDEKEAKIWLNSRYYNPYSSLFNRQAQITTLVHELGHVQGICKMNPLTEPATEVATTEVLAAMTRHGNKYAPLPFLRQVQAMAFDYLFSLYRKLPRRLPHLCGR